MTVHSRERRIRRDLEESDSLGSDTAFLLKTIDYLRSEITHRDARVTSLKHLINRFTRDVERHL